MKNCIVTYRQHGGNGNHTDHIAGELFGPEGCVMTAEKAQSCAKSLESRLDRLARVRESETEEKALELARLLCRPWFTRRQST